MKNTPVQTIEILVHQINRKQAIGTQWNEAKKWNQPWEGSYLKASRIEMPDLASNAEANRRDSRPLRVIDSFLHFRKKPLNWRRLGFVGGEGDGEMGKELLAIDAEDGELRDWVVGDGNDHVFHVDVSILDFPEDPTGKFDELKKFVRSNQEMCKWIGGCGQWKELGSHSVECSKAINFCRRHRVNYKFVLENVLQQEGVSSGGIGELGIERGIIELGIEDGKELELGNALASLGGGVDEFIMETWICRPSPEVVVEAKIKDAPIFPSFLFSMLCLLYAAVMLASCGTTIGLAQRLRRCAKEEDTYALSIILAMVLKVLGPNIETDYDSDDDYIPARLPLLRNQSQPNLTLKNYSWNVKL
ncbi:hypothetical protein ZIOFF_055188 [Zingiber officinale]|uniref:Uncharacterized protein n=1 Tax=Zingiber officinale TaxID=94328 RepID=A0A8J5FH30_ZINOF|nr:hypothetical protein ZIOFF_055188 [Zingiber officinale]